MKILLIILFSVLIISGCKIKDAEEPVKETTPDKNIVNNTLKQVRFKGMYSFSDDTGKFEECGTGRKFILASLGANKVLDSTFRSSKNNIAGKKLLLNTEGFSTVQQKKKGNDFDTVLVITRILETDSLHTCN